MGARTQLNGFYSALVVTIAVLVGAGSGSLGGFVTALAIGFAVCIVTGSIRSAGRH